MTLLEGQVEQTRRPCTTRSPSWPGSRACRGPRCSVEVTPTRPREMRIEAELTVGDEPVALDYASPAKDLTLDLPSGLPRRSGRRAVSGWPG